VRFSFSIQEKEEIITLFTFGTTFLPLSPPHSLYLVYGIRERSIPFLFLITVERGP